jgi:hypothetical protein
MLDLQYQQLDNGQLGEDEYSAIVKIVRFVCLFAVIIGLCLAYAWVQKEVTDVNYDIEQLRVDNAKLVEGNAALRIQQAMLADPSLVKVRALSLGLKHPDQRRIRYIQVNLDGQVDQTVVAAAVMPVPTSVHE